MMILLIQLFLAHLLGDFFLQPDRWVQEKETKKWASGYLYLHILVHLVLLLTITGVLRSVGQVEENFFYFLLPSLAIAGGHGVIDGIKLSLQKANTKRQWFVADQALHLLLLLAVVLVYQETNINWALLFQTKHLVVATAVLFLLQPASVLIKSIISKWSPNAVAAAITRDPETNAGAGESSLENAGALIGILERLLILLFVLLGKWEGVGFLLAAKSVFRFGDLKEARDRNLTEYVLIGTLLSFGIAMVTGVITVWLMHQ